MTVQIQWRAFGCDSSFHSDGERATRSLQTSPKGTWCHKVMNCFDFDSSVQIIFLNVATIIISQQWCCLCSSMEFKSMWPFFLKSRNVYIFLNIDLFYWAWVKKELTFFPNLWRLVELDVDRGMSWEMAMKRYENYCSMGLIAGFYVSKRDMFGQKMYILATPKENSTHLFHIARWVN